MSPKREICQCLSVEAGARGSTEPLHPSHFNCAWTAFAPRVRQLAARTIAKLPLKHLSARVQDACGGGFRLVPGGRVRATLGGDAFLDDLVQEVGLAFWRAVSAGKIFAARPAVHAWLETTAPRVARRAVRPAAILAFMAPANDNDGRDPVQLPEFALRFEASNDNALDNLKEALRDPELLLALTPSERSVLIPSLAGETPTQIAASLGLQVNAVRGRLHRARRHLRSLLAGRIRT